MRYSYILLIVVTLSAAPADAQNTGGVFGPIVNEGHRSFQYRIGFDPEGDRLAQRFHYQRSTSDRHMFRLIGQVLSDDQTGSDLDYIQGEWFVQLSEDDARWKRGVRFDLRYRDDDRPETIGLNWMHEYDMVGNWRFRAVLLTAIEFGNNARDGIFLNTRARLTRDLGPGRSTGIEWFGGYGSTTDFARLPDQQHQAGPYIFASLAGGYSIRGRVLLGLTDVSPDLELGVWFGKRF